MDEEGNIVSPLGCFKKMSVSPKSPQFSPSPSPPPSPVVASVVTTATPQMERQTRVKYETAEFVQKLVGQLNAKITSTHDIQLLVQSIFERDNLISVQHLVINSLNTTMDSQQLTISENYRQPDTHDVAIQVDFSENFSQPATHEDVAIQVDFSENFSQPDTHDVAIQDDYADDLPDLRTATATADISTICNLKHINKKLEAKLYTMRQAEQLLEKVSQQQRQLTISTLALNSKMKRTKMVIGQQSLYYATTEPRSTVRSEIATSSQNRRKGEETAVITKLVLIVEELSRKYSPEFARYESLSHTNDLVQQVNQQTQAMRKKVAMILPQPFEAMWNLYFEPDPPPPRPVFIPDVMPKINWSRLNKNYVRNLPVALKFLTLSAPADPDFYLNIEKKYGTMQLATKAVYGPGSILSPLFGYQWGHMTSLGIVPTSKEPVHGYILDGEGEWVIHAAVG